MEEEKMKQKVTKKAKGVKKAKETDEACVKHKANWREVYASPEYHPFRFYLERLPPWQVIHIHLIHLFSEIPRVPCAHIRGTRKLLKTTV